MTDKVEDVFIIVITCIYMLMAMWRILEVTLLNSYFNSFKSITEYEGKLSYIPPNQSLFAANMVSSVQNLLLSLGLIFDFLENNKNENLQVEMYLEEHSEDLNSVEYKKWVK